MSIEIDSVDRCEGNIAGTDFDADGGFAYSYECDLQKGHLGPHHSVEGGRECQWTDASTRFEGEVEPPR